MPFEASHLDAWITILYVQADIHREVNRQLDVAGRQSLEVYDVLLTLETAPEGAMDMTTLADQLLLTISGVSRMVDRLQTRGYVTVCRSARNHRCKLVSLTPEGLAEREASWRIYRSVLAAKFGEHLSEETAAQVSKALLPLLAGRKLIGHSLTNP